jgi:hypothetical protein
VIIKDGCSNNPDSKRSSGFDRYNDDNQRSTLKKNLSLSNESISNNLAQKSQDRVSRQSNKASHGGYGEMQGPEKKKRQSKKATLG